MHMTEADICRKFVIPNLQTAGWDNDPHSIAEQRTLNTYADARIRPAAFHKNARRAWPGSMSETTQAR